MEASFFQTQSFIEKCKDLRSYDNKFDEVQRFNFKINNINAAFGISQLKKLSQDIERRNIIANKYIKALKKSNLIDLDIYRYIEVYYKFPLLFLKNIDIQKIIDDLRNLQIPITPELVFNSIDKSSYPNSSSLIKRFYSIPCYPDLLDNEVEYIVKCLKKII